MATYHPHRHRLFYATGLMAFTFAVGTVGYYLVGGGGWALIDCLYMTAITLSTVGYHETVPVSQSVAGKLFTILLVTGGVATVLYFASTVMAFLVEGDLRNLLGSRRMEKRTRKLRRHYIVCGIGRTGRHTVLQLVRAGHDVVMVDGNADHIEHFLAAEELDLPFIIGDATSDAVLRHAGIQHARGLICALDSDQDNLYAVLTARELRQENGDQDQAEPPGDLRIVAKVSGAAAARKFRLVGADAVVAPAELGGIRLSIEMTAPAAGAFFDRLSLPENLDLTVNEVTLGSDSSLANRTLAESNLRQQVGNVLILASCPPDASEFIYNPPATTRLEPGTRVMAMGGPDEVRRLQELAQ